MKHLILTCFLISLTQIAFSQTLTQSGCEPVAGETDRRYRLDTSLFTTGLPHAVKGSGVVWDFTKLQGTYPITVDSFNLPSASPGNSLYPGSTYVQHLDDLYSYYKSVQNPSQTELLGAWSTSLILTFTNSAIVAGYPVNYGYHLVDPVSGSYKYNTTNGPCNGSIEVTADGTGTLNLPGNITFTNVLRLKTVQTVTLASGIFPVGSYQQVTYNYYSANQKFPIINFRYTTYQLLIGTPTITAYGYGMDDYFTIVGLNQNALEKGCEVYPTPFHDVLSIPLACAQVVSKYRFYTITGAKIAESCDLNQNLLQNLPEGLLFIELEGPAGTLRKKIYKE